jgi:hypothetical protein
MGEDADETYNPEILTRPLSPQKRKNPTKAKAKAKTAPQSHAPPTALASPN